MIAQLAQTAMGFVDTLMAGQVSAQDLAAIALGSSIWMPLQLSLSGILMATTPLIAHQVGAERLDQTSAISWQGVWVAVVAASLSVIILNSSDTIMVWMNVAPDLAEKTLTYMSAVSWGFPALLLYQICRSFSEGFGKTRPIMKIALMGLAANIPLNYIFIYGKLGIPAMGAVGCGWATAIVMWLMLFAGALYLRKSPSFNECLGIAAQKRPNGDTIKEILKLGIPIGISLLIEASMFSVIALLLAESGEIIVAAHQITLSVSGMTFMIPLSIAMAITIRVGQLLGADKRQQARHSAFCGIAITLAFAVSSASLMFLLPEFIASWYTDNTTLIALAASLITIAALFQVTDSIQVTCAGALRGYKDTSVPLAMVFVAYWVIGLPTGYSLALTDWITTPMGPVGFWIGLVTGLSLGAILLLSRLIKLSNKSVCVSPSGY